MLSFSANQKSQRLTPKVFLCAHTHFSPQTFSYFGIPGHLHTESTYIVIVVFLFSAHSIQCSNPYRKCLGRKSDRKKGAHEHYTHRHFCIRVACRIYTKHTKIHSHYLRGVSIKISWWQYKSVCLCVSVQEVWKRVIV